MTTKNMKNTTSPPARPRRTLAQGLIVAQRGNLTRIATLTGQLIERLDYQNDPATQRFWAGIRDHPVKAQFEGATQRRHRECFAKIASLSKPWSEQLKAITEAILKAAEDERFTLLEQQAEVIRECRADLRRRALHLRKQPAAHQEARRHVAPAPVPPPMPIPWTWPKLPGALEYA
jgi:hypothetical protein